MSNNDQFTDREGRGLFQLQRVRKNSVDLMKASIISIIDHEDDDND